MTFNNNAFIEGNSLLRTPQIEGWLHVRRHFANRQELHEVGIVLPVGCGKSGLIAITPYAVSARRVLIIAPRTKIRDQLGNDLRSDSDQNFYEGYHILSSDAVCPEVAVIESGRTNLDDIRHCDIAVTNIQQRAGDENRWLDNLEQDVFDLILVDEGHHNTAESWKQVKGRFPNARVVNFSATPSRADGKLMAGEIIYSFPVVQAIEAGYIKRLRARMLSPNTLRYVDRENEQRVISLDEVRRLGETDAEFRRGIVMSDETLNAIVDQTINELRELRKKTGERRLKIIASAINYAHCIQITEAFRSRGLSADFVHSREETNANDRVFERLENHEIDVIVQARMLGEGFNHKYLAVAMVGSIFANLSPFVQFVGRIMRAIEQNTPGHPLNQGVVVFHVGANVAGRWDDFRHFSQADQDFFSELLPEAEEVNFDDETVTREPGGDASISPVNIIEETEIRITDMVPIGDPHAMSLVEQLADTEVTPEQVAEELHRIRTTRQSTREARRKALSERVQNEVGGILGRLKIKLRGRALDSSKRLDNFAWVASEIHRRIDQSIGGQTRDRQNFTLDQLNQAHDILSTVVSMLEREISDGAS
jgi:superfamily II DNA or RNA helicase